VFGNRDEYLLLGTPLTTAPHPYHTPSGGDAEQIPLPAPSGHAAGAVSKDCAKTQLKVFKPPWDAIYEVSATQTQCALARRVCSEREWFRPTI
jgi:hypothetical protein